MNSEKETESAQSSADIDTPPNPIDIRPDGGLEAWMVVAGAWGACFCSWGWINSWFFYSRPKSEINHEKGVGVFQEYYGKNILKEYTPGTVSWILCLEAFFLLALVSDRIAFIVKIGANHQLSCRHQLLGSCLTDMGLVGCC